MYPIDCFDVFDSSKMEAVRYYLDLNKKFLKETSREEYELFAEFLKGSGKDIFMQIEKATTNKELFSFFLKLEKQLPYAKDLAKAKTFEEKTSYLHTAFAKLRVNEEKLTESYSSVLKKQRAMAGEYDELQDTVGKYRDIAVSYEEIKAQLKNIKTMSQVISSRKNMSVSEVLETIKTSLDQKKETLKEKRAEAFDKISEYYIKEQVYVLEQQKLAGIER